MVAKTDARAVKFHGYNSFYTKLDSKKKETAKQGQQLGHNNITFAQKHSSCLCSITIYHTRNLMPLKGHNWGVKNGYLQYNMKFYKATPKKTLIRDEGET